MPEIRLKGPLRHQSAAYMSAASRKILRWGRRAGKTRIGFLAGIAGHGPQGSWSVTCGRNEAARTESWDGPMHRGVSQGYDVYWIARDYRQAGILWREEVTPKFKSLGGDVRVNESDRRVDFRGLGSFVIRSAENIDSVRGSGERLAGVIVDEAAYMDLQSALKDVLLPALVDNSGWLVLLSTTNAGPDGYEDLEVGKRTPSYFNLLCEACQAGTAGPEWEEFYSTGYDNDALPIGGMDALVAEYPSLDDPSCQQEVFARLLQAGAGVAFPELREDVHLSGLLPEDPAFAHLYRWSAGGDWGFTKPGGLWLMATGPERSIVRHEFYFRGRTPYDVGFSWGKQTMRFPRHEFIAIDTPAVSDGGPTILEGLQRGMNAAVPKNAPVFINPPKGPGSRITKKNLLHAALSWRPDEDGLVHEWGLPQLLFHRTGCPEMVRTLWRLPRDPKKPEDVDTAAEDHPYDGLTSWLMARTPHVEREKATVRNPDRADMLAVRRKRAQDEALVEAGPRWSRFHPEYEDGE